MWFKVGMKNADRHDVSWGTKGDNKVETDLGIVKPAGDGKTDKVDITVPTDEKDINAAYDDACHVLANKPPPEKETVDVETKMTDSYRNIRTNVVLAWALMNVSPTDLARRGFFCVCWIENRSGKF